MVGDTSDRKAVVASAYSRNETLGTEIQVINENAEQQRPQ